MGQQEGWARNYDTRHSYSTPSERPGQQSRKHLYGSTIRPALSNFERFRSGSNGQTSNLRLHGGAYVNDIIWPSVSIRNTIIQPAFRDQCPTAN